ncbi:MAG: GxxExxY protein [Verrucomicrobiota bacterium]
MEKLNDRDLSKRVIGAAIEVHKALGPGFLESFYEEALSIELDILGIPYERQKTVEITYRSRKIGEHRLDLLVDGRLVLELKAVQSLDPIHYSTVRSYMKALGVESGIIINFSTMPATIKRVGREFTPSSGLSFS